MADLLREYLIKFGFVTSNEDRVRAALRATAAEVDKIAVKDLALAQQRIKLIAATGKAFGVQQGDYQKVAAAVDKLSAAEVKAALQRTKIAAEMLRFSGINVRAAREGERAFDDHGRAAERFGNIIGRSAVAPLNALIRQITVLAATYFSIRGVTTAIQDLARLDDQSRRVGASVNNIRAMEQAWTAAGGAIGEAAAAMDSIKESALTDPGAAALLKNFGVTATDTAEQMLQLGKAFQGMDLFVAVNFGKRWGLSASQVRTMRDDHAKLSLEYEKNQKFLASFGVDAATAARNSKELAVQAGRFAMGLTQVRDALFLGSAAGGSGFMGKINAWLEGGGGKKLATAAKAIGDALGDWLTKEGGAADRFTKWLTDVSTTGSPEEGKWLSFIETMKSLARTAWEVVLGFQAMLDAIKPIWAAFDQASQSLLGQNGLTTLIELLAIAYGVKLVGGLMGVVSAAALALRSMTALAAVTAPAWLPALAALATLSLKGSTPDDAKEREQFYRDNPGSKPSIFGFKSAADKEREAAARAHGRDLHEPLYGAPPAAAKPPSPWMEIGPKPGSIIDDLKGFGGWIRQKLGGDVIGGAEASERLAGGIGTDQLEKIEDNTEETVKELKRASSAWEKIGNMLPAWAQQALGTGGVGGGAGGAGGGGGGAGGGAGAGAGGGAGGAGGGVGGGAGAGAGGGAGAGAGGKGAPAAGGLRGRIGTLKTALQEQLKKEGVPQANLEEASNLLAGQAITESGVNPEAVHDKGTGLGIYGARDPGGKGPQRRTDMLNWIKAQGLPYGTQEQKIAAQGRFMAHEAMASGRYPKTRAALMGAEPGSREQRGYAITKEFEAPAARHLRSRAQEIGQAAGVPAGAGAEAGPEGGVVGRQGSVVERQRQVAGTRKGALDARLRAALGYASERTGLTADVTSGGQRMPGAPGAVGSHRHDRGRAADFNLRDEKGRIVSPNDPRALAFSRYAAQAGVTGGGEGYMSDPSKIHLDVAGSVYAGSRAFRESVRRGQGEAGEYEAYQKQRATRDAARREPPRRAADDIPWAREDAFKQRGTHGKPYTLGGDVSNDNSRKMDQSNTFNTTIHTSGDTREAGRLLNRANEQTALTLMARGAIV